MTLEEATTKDLTVYKTIIYGAPLYAGTFKGKELLEKYENKL